MKRDRQAEALRWFRQAEVELKDAAFLKESGKLYLALFLCQQSAEKDFQDLKAAKRLDDYYIPTRYPNGLPGEIPSEYYDNYDEVEKALEMSRKVVEMSKRKIGEI